jgi:DNA polymerase-3 subunit alpha
VPDDDTDPPPLHLQADASIAEAVQRREGEWVAVGGSVTHVRMVATGGGERIARLTLTDFHASVEVLVFAKSLAVFEPQVDDVIVVGGRVTHAAKGVVLVAQLVERFDWQDLVDPPAPA